MNRSISFILIILFFYGCKTHSDKSKSKISATVFSELLDSALASNTIEFERAQPFLFFKSGNIFSKTEKTAIAVFCSTDTTYSIQLFTENENKWQMIDSIGGLNAFPVQFNPVFDDYNFDEQTDLYIQVTASNGYSLSLGHLLIVDPATKKITVHEEARKLANMHPDKKQKTVFSEDVIWCKSNGQQEVCRLSNKWINGNLTTIKKDCPCDSD